MAKLVCPVCGTENPATRLFCRKCAADLHAPAPDPNAAVAPTSAPIPMRPLAIGAGIALIVVALMIGLFAVFGGSATPPPSPSRTLAPTATPTLLPAATLTPTATTTLEPTTEPTIVPTATTSPSSGTGNPFVDTLSGPRRASCTGANGTGTPGYIHLSWTASNTTGVRLSIDPPAPNNAYDFGYDDYPAEGSADLPFTCDPPSSDANGPFHLYVATTIHDNGRFAYRFIRVYLRD